MNEEKMLELLLQLVEGQKQLAAEQKLTNQRLDQMDGRLDQMDQRFDQMDGRLDQVDQRLDQEMCIRDSCGRHHRMAAHQQHRPYDLGG